MLPGDITPCYKVLYHPTMKTFYINAPLLKDEHDAVAALALKNGRAKGQQLRVMVLAGLAEAKSKRGLRVRKGERV